ncbi:hypothetical protein AB9F42_02690 [Rhizobium leguminosarum]|uniref:hypothetical protein n=1 Tax=Rhizobium leguminosarum TaxID=384 RepID=UPI003F9C6F7F
MVTDAVYGLRMCARDKPAIDIIEHTLEMEDEGIRLDLMGRALKIWERSQQDRRRRLSSAKFKS